MDIFVGNLSFETNDGDVKKLFEGFGNVASAVVVMRKEKKTPKSRGFGFVQMPDEQQALAAITALNGKEFMGRVLDVSPARPKGEIKNAEAQKVEVRKVEVKKIEARVESALEKKNGPDVAAEAGKKPLFSRKPGTYRGGRRTSSYMKQRGLTGMQEEDKPRRRGQENPMRWRKKKNRVKPREKIPGGRKK